MIFSRGALLAAILLSACAKNVVVRGEFPAPVVQQLPHTLGIHYKPEFRNHEFFDEAASREETDWLVRTGEAQVKMHDILLPGMFAQVVPVAEFPFAEGAPPPPVDAVLVPSVEELQYSVPSHTKIPIFEIWMRYKYELFAPSGELLADWTMTAYGKTPSPFMRSAEASVNAAAIVALRDAGANFALNFARVPDVRDWLESAAPPEEPPLEQRIKVPHAGGSSP